MVLRDLLAAIETEAASDISRLRAERHREAAVIIAEARREADAIEAAAVAAAEQEEQEAAELRLTADRAAITGRLRDAYEAAYQEIARDIRVRLGTVRERGDYPAILAALLGEAHSALPAATLIRCDPADEPLVQGLLGGENRLRAEATLSCAGGVEVTDESGVSVRNTVEERFTAAEPVLRALVGRLLGLDPPGDPRARDATWRVAA